MPSILLHLLPNILAAVVYAALGYHFWRTRWAETDKPHAAQPMQAWERWTIGGALLVLVQASTPTSSVPARCVSRSGSRYR